MNKAQFLTILRKELRALPQKERDELVEDYEHHYVFGQSAGKSEEEISAELGDPNEIAAEVLAEYEQRNPIQHSISSRNNRSRTIMACIGLFILNFMVCVVPLGLSVWAAWLSLFAGSIIVVLSPFAAIVDFITNDYYGGGKLFASIAMSGIGIMLSIGLFSLGAMLKKVTISYVRWNLSVIRGGK